MSYTEEEYQEYLEYSKKQAKKPKPKLPKLTRKQWEKLDIQYANTPPLTDSMSASGEHYILIHLLNEFGFHPHSREEAMELTEELLSNGWK
ncbi:hypothetical protein QUF64_16405 [Anaerolineales bacterium HSG6]|nr:hypothetical protein [Anaerolineales bacterium HSG6]MDM8532232.1 hypothetical protein [Anaerolineales bacterium HSG25]